eukprot:CAMPEP_0201485760 /NCGR_PEP_ID=MMETSP0151_2-20130828/9877_1 /ASSEMBLY_ACC=CAM_ASM_000257 /TAXON_ID=200890 /ORGANISM="Paramoeba atlantica, Strain 621/1 / CCAP 1560/9" /LENGTH=108 /DNA_ID=CAMNT_0047870065 /DNA_START=151 /DNA_END=477 /DNA_ORIENTATION=-
MIEVKLNFLLANLVLFLALVKRYEVSLELILEFFEEKSEKKERILEETTKEFVEKMEFDLKKLVLFVEKLEEKLLNAMLLLKSELIKLVLSKMTKLALLKLIKLVLLK